MEAVVEETKTWTLNANDRCDAKECKAQAYVDVKGVTGNLLFCSHHYNKIMSNEKASEKMNAFAFETIDERERLIENRTKGED
jgi:hypothetical protein